MGKDEITTNTSHFFLPALQCPRVDLREVPSRAMGRAFEEKNGAWYYTEKETNVPKLPRDLKNVVEPIVEKSRACRRIPCGLSPLSPSVATCALVCVCAVKFLFRWPCTERDISCLQFS